MKGLPVSIVIVSVVLVSLGKPTRGWIVYPMSRGLRYRGKGEREEEWQEAMVVRSGSSLSSSSSTVWIQQLWTGGVPTTMNSFLITRDVFTRALGAIYAIAFLIAYNQNKALIGAKYGLLPIPTYLDMVGDRLFGSGTNETIVDKWRSYPTFFWGVNGQRVDEMLDWHAILGLGLSMVLMSTGTANWVIMGALYAIYLSLVNVGQTFYSFGWESQLLETGFLATFLYHPFKLTKAYPVSWACVFGYRWLLFRIMLGAGLIKFRGGDSSWKDLTALRYHYETQPVPGPFSRILHCLPDSVHTLETLSNHFVELIAPFFLLAPFRSVRIIGGLVQIIFQTALICSGNLSFLNWLTMLPAIWCFDDQFFLTSFNLETIFPSATSFFKIIRRTYLPSVPRLVYHGFSALLIVVLTMKSIPVVQNLLSSRQIMNRSFDPFRIVNTYGAFGTVTKTRYEIIIQACTEYKGDDTEWKEYFFPVKPGEIDRPCPWITPYHYRLDWVLWILCVSTVSESGVRFRNIPTWFVALLYRLLENRPEFMSQLVRVNPFEEAEDGPKYIKADIYKYILNCYSLMTGPVWTRERVGPYTRLLSKNELTKMVALPKV